MRMSLQDIRVARVRADSLVRKSRKSSMNRGTEVRNVLEKEEVFYERR